VPRIDFTRRTLIGALLPGLAVLIAITFSTLARSNQDGEPTCGHDWDLFYVVDNPPGLLVLASVNGRPATLLLDTRASRTTVSPDMFSFDPSDPRLSHLNLGNQPGMLEDGFLETARVGVGNVTNLNLHVGVMNMRHVSEIYGRQIDGLLALDALREMGQLSVDFPHGTIVFPDHRRTDYFGNTTLWVGLPIVPCEVRKK
jgi:hypothetical protein